MQSSNNTQWSNPSPAGLVALAVSCFGFFALLGGHVTEKAMPLFAVWLLGGFVVQLVVGLIDLKNQNTTGGNTFLYFSAFFMFVGGIEMLLKFNFMQSGVVVDAHIDGWAWAALALVVLLWTPAFFKTSKVLTFIILGLDVAVPFISLIDLGILPKATFAFIPAYALLFSGLCGVYLSAAIIVNNAFGKEIYPNPGPFIK